MSGDNKMPQKPLAALDEQEVAAYLHEAPDFFLRHPELYAMMELAPRGASKKTPPASKEKNASHESIVQHLDELFSVARRNSELFAQMKKFVLAVLDAGDLDTVLGTVLQDLEQNFRIPVTRILLFRTPPVLGRYDNVAVIPLERARENIAHILDSRKPTCGLLRDEERQFLFGPQAARVASAAIIPLADEEGVLGLLSLGNGNENHYQPGADDLFIGYMGEVLQRVLTRHLRAAD